MGQTGSEGRRRSLTFAALSAARRVWAREA